MPIINNVQAVGAITELADLGEGIKRGFPLIRGTRVESETYKQNLAYITNNIAKYKLKLQELLVFLEKNINSSDVQYNNIKTLTGAALETIINLEQQYKNILIEKLPQTPIKALAKTQQNKPTPPPPIPLEMLPSDTNPIDKIMAKEDSKKLEEFQKARRLVDYYNGKLSDKPNNPVNPNVLSLAKKNMREAFNKMPEYLRKGIIAMEEGANPESRPNNKKSF